jgi:hypothetical protein
VNVKVTYSSLSQALALHLTLQHTSLDSTADMVVPSSLVLREHIFHCISDFRGPLFDDAAMRIISANIAFLINHTAVADLDSWNVSIPYIAIRGPYKEEVGRKASVIVHRGPMKFTVIMEVQVEWDGDVMAALTRRVDILVNATLSGALMGKVVDNITRD